MLAFKRTATVAVAELDRRIAARRDAQRGAHNLGLSTCIANELVELLAQRETEAHLRRQLARYRSCAGTN